MKSEQGQTDLPWQGILTLAVAVTGTVFYFAPLNTSRPTERTAALFKADRLQAVDARLWEDPLGVVNAHEAAVQATDQNNPYQEGRPRDDAHSQESLAKEITRATSPGNSRPLWVLAVMIPNGPYAEYVEARLRMRRAVMEGLSTNGFAPKDGEHLGYARFQWPNDPTQPVAPPLILPYEWCEPMFDGPREIAKPDILVLWLQDEVFQRAPLTHLNVFLNTLGISPARTPVKVIGPHGSTGLLGLVSEALDDHLIEALNQPKADGPDKGTLPLKDVTIFSATPTASDEMLLRSTEAIRWKLRTQKQCIKELFLEKVPAIHFHRLTANDEDTCGALITELGRRGVWVSRYQITGKKSPSIDHVALISEWDTFYGRALPLTFARLASGSSVDQLLEHYPANIHPFQYLRGIDGMLPGSTGKETTQKNGDEDKKPGLPRETTEGLNQADYLRRLASQLQELNQDLLYKEHGGLKAVGVLGSDVYDKLLVLKSLRRALPGVLFFTNNLDARLGHPDEWDWTRNLIVASPFGFRLSRGIRLGSQSEYLALQGKAPPFRDSDQTAVYTAATAATNEKKAKFLVSSLSQLKVPRVFEIGRSGPYELETSTHHEILSLHPDYRLHWWNPTRSWLAVAVGCSLAALAAWVSWVLVGKPRETPVLSPWAARAEKSDAAGKAKPERFELAAPTVRTERVSLLSPGAILIMGVLAAWLIVTVLANLQRSDPEPLVWLEGISIWPTEMIRLLAIILGVFFAWKTHSVLEQNQADIEAEFGLEPPKPHRDRRAWFSRNGWEKRIRRLTLLYWEVQNISNLKINAQALWNEYVWSGSLSRRVMRIIPLLICYLAAATCLVFLLGRPHVPYRGEYSRIVDLCFLNGTIFVSTALTFYVADATILNRRFIHYITVNDTEWPPRTFVQIRELRKLALKDPYTPPDDLLCDYLEIEIIAKRTEVVSNLIYYPFAVIFLMIISRSNLFDDWDWPVSLILMLLFNGGYAAWSAFRLRNSAEKARQMTLQRLGNLLVAYTAAGEGLGPEAGTIREMVAAIQSESRGAFASLSHHPILGAVLLPSGGLGIWALGQYLPKFFQ